MRSTNQNPGCLGALFALFGGSPSPLRSGSSESPEDAVGAVATYPYLLRDDFLSPAELSFYRVLAVVVADRAVICPKVNLWDIFFVSRPHENSGAKSRIDRKHVDFVLCSPDTMRPLMAIELDDSSHARPDRQKRDALVDAVFAAAGLPLIHCPAQRGYTLTDLAATVRPHLETDAASAMSPLRPGVDPDGVASDPLCPKCGVPMALRQAARGPRPGQAFFGCPNYPRCRQTRPAAP